MGDTRSFCHAGNSMIFCRQLSADLHRLERFLHRLKEDPTILKEYDDIIKDQLKMETIETIPNEDPPSDIHYMPHYLIHNECVRVI